MKRFKGRALDEALELKEALDNGITDDDRIGESSCPACHSGLWEPPCGWCSEHQCYRCEDPCGCLPPDAPTPAEYESAVKAADQLRKGLDDLRVSLRRKGKEHHFDLLAQGPRDALQQVELVIAAYHWYENSKKIKEMKNNGQDN